MNSRNIILCFSIIGLLIACGPGEQGPQKEPTDLAGWRSLLKEKQTQLGELRKEIAHIEDNVSKLDTSQAARTKLVTTIKPEIKDFKRFIDIQGSVLAEDVLRVSSETGGRIVRLNVREGQRLSKGALVAKLDLESLDKQKQELETALDLARNVYERQSRLWKQNIGSEIQYLEAKNNKERLEKSLETIAFQIKKANVYAPSSGVVEMIMINEGEMASPGMPIFTILDDRMVKVVADLPENYLKSVRRGEKVEVTFPAIELNRMATVSLIGSSINPANRTFPVEVKLSNKDRLLKPNLLASMKINDFTRKNAILVPLQIVKQEIGGKDYVFEIIEGAESKTIEKRYITTAESFEGMIIVEEGLEGDELLIKEGASGLTNGALVDYSPINESKDGE